METSEIESMRRALARMAASLRIDDIAMRLRVRGAGELVSRADEVMRHMFTFNKTWDMERCNEPYEFTGDDWNVVNHDDEEWCFMLNRMDYLIDLVAATLVTGDRSYAHRALELIDSWIGAHPQVEPELSTRTLDTGIRLVAWAQVLPVLEHLGLLDDARLAAIRKSIYDQTSYLEAHYLPKYETSNWGSIQTLGVLFTLCTIEEEPERHPQWQWAFDRAASQMRAQVYPDGVDWEQSTMYHVEVLLGALRTRHAFEVRGIEAPAHLIDASARLSRALCAQMMPSGKIDAQGDSDRCNVRGLLALCAAMCHDGTIKAACGRQRLDNQDLFEYGCSVEDALGRVDTCGVPPMQFDGEDAGLFISRSSWEEDATWTLFSHGPLGSGHGHSDNLHVSCAYRGVPVLIDSGRFTYREDEPLRPALKGPKAHNVLLLDGASNCQPKGSWGYHDFARPLKTYVRHANGVHYYEGALIGHHPLHVLTRRLFAFDAGMWVCCDEALADGSHGLEARLHFDPGLRLESAAGESPSAFDVRGRGIELVLGGTGEGHLERDVCSLAYNALQDQALVRMTCRVDDWGRMVWWLVPQGARVHHVPVLRNLDTPVEHDVAEALRIELSPDEFYTVVLFYGEVFSGVKAFSCEGVSFHAKAMVIHGRGEDRELTVLRA